MTSLVRRDKAPRYIFLMVLSFATTVVVTRYYLELTGYPQIGGGDLHIAHLLWGGLALFIASLLPLLIANQGTYYWAAVLSGVGVGLFIDEVGKFITKTNDYFYPAAAPIIYGVFLLTVLLYIEIRRRDDATPRGRFYAVLDQLPVVFDQNLTPEELTDLTDHLQAIADQKANPTLAHLATNLLAFFRSEQFNVVQKVPTWYDQLWADFQTAWQKHVTRGRHRWLLVLGLGLPQLVALAELLLLVVIILNPTQVITAWAQDLLSSGQLDTLNNIPWLAVRLFLDGLTGVMALAGAILLLVRKEQLGLSLGIMALVLSLTVNNLVVFYQDQFQALTFTLIQGVILLLAVLYRRWYLTDDSTDPSPAASAPTV